MSTVTYLVFENSAQVLNMDKMPVFKNGSEMPWTYYTASIEEDTTNNNEARKRFMYTCESKPSSAGALDAGKHVSKICKYVPTGTMNGNAVQYRSVTIENPTVHDYESWGWKLQKNADGQSILPTYGEFQFQPGCEPSYEDMSSINIKFRFGFGLGNTCYNYATENATVQVYNLSCAPQLFCSQNEYCDIRYDPATGKYNELTGEIADADEIKCELKEGTDSNGDAHEMYLFVAVEAGEQVQISFPYRNTELEKQQLQFDLENGSSGILDSDSSTYDLSEAYRVNVQGQSTLPQASLEGIKFDFYRIKVSAASAFRDIVYNKVNELCAYIKVTPVTYGTVQSNFARTVKLTVCLTKDNSPPRLDNSLWYRASDDSWQKADHNNVDNMRQRIVVTPEEAINYAVKTNDSAAPSFVKGNSAAGALRQYQESLLTPTELALDIYKESLSTTAMREKLAFYVATDLSDDAADVLTSWNEAGIQTCDISAVLLHNDLVGTDKLKDQIKTELTNKNIMVTLANVKANNTTAECFQTFYDRFFKTNAVTLRTDGTKEVSSDINSATRPWADGQMFEPRKFGSIRDTSCSYYDDSNINAQQTAAANQYWGTSIDTSGQRKTLMGQESTILTLLFALNNHHKTGSDALVKRYADAMNLYEGNRLERLYQAMRTEYHGIKNWTLRPSTLVDPSGASSNRPAGLYDDLMNYRYRINPVDGASAFNYLCNIMSICHTGSAPDKIFYGTNELYDHFNVPRASPSKDDVNELLYGNTIASNLEAQIRGSGKLINTDTNIGSYVEIANQFLKQTKEVGSDVHMIDGTTYKGAVFYESSITTSNFGSDHKAATNHMFNQSRTEDIKDISCIELNKKFIYNVSVASNAKVYSEQNFHPENCDFSGVMKIPNSVGGKYVDVFVVDPTTGNEIEVRETIVDTVATCEKDGGPQTADPSKNMDMSTSQIAVYNGTENPNEELPQSVKDSRKTLIKDLTEKYDIVNAGIFQIYRTGNVLQFTANALDLDSEIMPAMTMPTLKLRYRHDVNAECLSIYNDICLALKDVPSTLYLSFNTNRTTECIGLPTEAEDITDASSTALLSRWGDAYIPVDISGFLERGEEFKLTVKNDKFATTNNNFTNGQKAWNDRTNFSTETSLPTGCEDQAVRLQYKNAREPDSEWLDVTSETRFTYECHDNTKAMGNNDRNTFGDISPSSGFDATKSSNVKGTPKFRLCVPSQNKLLVLYQTGQPSGQDVDLENFGTLKRTFDIHLEYSKSSLLTNQTTSSVTSNNTWYKDNNGADKTLEATLFIKSDTYAPNIQEYGYNYTKKYTGLQTTLAARNGIDATNHENVTTGNYFNSANFKAVAHKVINRPGQQQECEPDYTSLQAYDISQTHYSSKLSKVSFVDATMNENMFGIQKPVSLLCLDNFEINGEYSATAKIVPLFQRTEDENDWETDNSVYCKIDNVRDTNNDASNGANRMIPANTNYGLSIMDNGTKIALYRKTNLNYEQWIGGAGDIVNGHDFYNDTNNQAYPELVAVKITYHEPNALFGTKGQKKEKTIVFLVRPNDCKDMQWQDTFHFEVNDGDKEVDITSVLSATVEGNTNDNIKYFVRGFIDESGTVYHTSGLGDLSTNEQFRARYDVSQLTLITSETTGLEVDKASNDIITISSDLKTKIVDGKLKLYEDFNAWTQCAYKVLIEAQLCENDQQVIEKCLTMVCIDVKQGATDFSIKDNTTYYYSVTETLGTIAEGKNEATNNPEIALNNFTDKIKHEDITDLYNVTAPKQVTFKIISMDDKLELCPADNKDFSNQKIRLKDIPENKTTETATKPSVKLGDYPHYNYERQNEYHIHIEVCASKYKEISVEKVPEAYVCELGRAAAPGGTSFSQTNSSSQYRTASYILSDSTNTLFSDSDNDGVLFYFCDPETNKYHGPLSRQPRTLSELSATKEIYGTQALYSYVRHHDKNSGYEPLYKARNFAITDKPPKPEDCATFLFSIRVQDSYDKPKVCPQPYELGDCVDYYSADPKHQTLLDNTQVDVKAGNRHVMYVYTDNVDLGAEGIKDFESGNEVPAWHPDYAAGKTFTSYTPVIHEDMSNQVNGSWNSGLRNGNPDGYMNGSNRYGNFNMDASTNRVVVDYFVESHGCIDAAGKNEVSRERMLGKPEVFGEQVDYSGTLFLNDTTGDDTKTSISGTDRRMYRLCRVNRNRLHANDLNSSANIHRYTTGELRFNDAHCPQVGDVYSFSIAAVTNILATKNDISMNKSMIDYREDFYPKISTKYDGTSSTTKYPQPYQKYVYDQNLERIVTLGYAKHTTDSTVNANATASQTNANQFSNDNGVLLVCRTHFKVCVKSDGIEVQSTNPETGATSVAKGLNFNSTSILEATVSGSGSGSTITPIALFEAKEGDVRLFKKSDGTIVMGVYKAGKWTTV